MISDILKNPGAKLSVGIAGCLILLCVGLLATLYLWIPFLGWLSPGDSPAATQWLVGQARAETLECFRLPIIGLAAGMVALIYLRK